MAAEALLDVVSALNPIAASMRADTMSHGFGITKVPGSA
jgi:hypothetical protein